MSSDIPQSDLYSGIIRAHINVDESIKKGNGVYTNNDLI